MEPISLHYHLNQFFNRFSHYPCIIIILSLFQSNCEYLTDNIANIIIHNTEILHMEVPNTSLSGFWWYTMEMIV